MTRKIVSEMTYNVSSGTLNTTVAKPLSKPDDKVGRCEWERVGCV